MAIYDKLNKTISDRDVDASLDLIPEDAVFVFHKSSDKFLKPVDIHVCRYDGQRKVHSGLYSFGLWDDDILVVHNFISYPDDSKEAVMIVSMIKNGQIIDMKTGYTPM